MMCENTALAAVIGVISEWSINTRHTKRTHAQRFLNMQILTQFLSFWEE